MQALYRITVLALLSIAIGTLASLAAIGFVELVAWLNDLLLVAPRARIIWETRPLLVMAATILAPTLGGLIVGLMLARLTSQGRGFTPPDAILAVQTRTSMPSFRDGLVSSLAAALSLGAGASVGQYGPMAYMGAQIGALGARLNLGIAHLQGVAIGCGVAAAISTAFNAPIAGLVFAHEVILRHYSLRAFAPTTVAAATGYVFANVVFEHEPLFTVAFEGVKHSYEFVFFALEGILCAFIAIAFMQLILACQNLSGRMSLPFAFRPMLAGLAVGLVALELPEVMGIGYEALRFATIEGAFAGHELALLVVAKIVLTALCLGFGFPGGVFSPSLLIGILFGALFGMIVAQFSPFDTSGIVVYAICGMMAVTSPVIGAPLTTIIVVFELTRSYPLTIAAMVSVVFANLVAFRLFGRSIFDVQLLKRGCDLARGRDGAILSHTYLTDYMVKEFPRCDRQDRLGDLRARLCEQSWDSLFVTDSAGQYLGTLTARHILAQDPECTAEQACVRSPVIFDETTSIRAAMDNLVDFLGEAAPVVSSQDGRLIGVAPEGVVISAYLDISRELRREENEAA
ncbi:chloride channel protein [Fodinicurvata fenggangensis]|uniref:chloride channel protein n=1 Tax=Fodinicurvata fenggangensis TaxID=1121830 RepID=UPI00068FF163|nr:chloride channel protein [Fodinicurvata fenggangensis]